MDCEAGFFSSRFELWLLDAWEDEYMVFTEPELLALVTVWPCATAFMLPMGFADVLFSFSAIKV